MSRTRARKSITEEEFARSMEGRVWQRRDSRSLVDEAPQAYKDIDKVMEDQKDLVEVLHELRGILSYKGVERTRRSRAR
jgi:tRNA-splicing ligase RtcB